MLIKQLCSIITTMQRANIAPNWGEVRLLDALGEAVRLLDLTCLAKGHSDREIRSPAPST